MIIIIPAYSFCGHTTSSHAGGRGLCDRRTAKGRMWRDSAPDVCVDSVLSYVCVCVCVYVRVYTFPYRSNRYTQMCMLETTAYFNCLKKNDEDDTKCSIERQALAKCSMLLNVRIDLCVFLLLPLQTLMYACVHARH